MVTNAVWGDATFCVDLLLLPFSMGNLCAWQIDTGFKEETIQKQVSLPG
jgi:hypothetical protein